MTPDEKADRIVKGLVVTGAAAGGIPVPLLVPFMVSMAGGVVAIGACYGVSLTKDEAWKLIREFFKAAGFAFMATQVGGLVIGTVMAMTGFGYPVALAMDAAQCAVIAYAIGAAAKHYFKHDQSLSGIRGVIREATRAAKADLVRKGGRLDVRKQLPRSAG
jgi:uncharacterized protein (DUF697 family)